MILSRAQAWGGELLSIELSDRREARKSRDLCISVLAMCRVHQAVEFYGKKTTFLDWTHV